MRSVKKVTVQGGGPLVGGPDGALDMYFYCSDPRMKPEKVEASLRNLLGPEFFPFPIRVAGIYNEQSAEDALFVLGNDRREGGRAIRSVTFLPHLDCKAVKYGCARSLDRVLADFANRYENSFPCGLPVLRVFIGQLPEDTLVPVNFQELRLLLE